MFAPPHQDGGIPGFALIHQSFLPTADDRGPSSTGGPRLADLLAQLAAEITAIEADCAASGISVALPRQRAVLDAQMDALGGWINAFLAAQPSEAEVQAAKAHITDVIHRWSRTGPFFDRSYGKLRGYPGDHETLEILYTCRPSGADLRARIFDDYYLRTLAARAIRNRLTCLAAQLEEAVQACAAQSLAPVRVLSLGSGPARELVLLADNPGFSEVAAITCLDQSSEALRYVRSRLNGRLNNRVTYLRGNPLRFAHGPARPSRPYHIIYSGDMLDYLDAEQARQLIEDCYSLLAPGGRLIFGGMGAGLPANERVLLAWLLAWHLSYRSEEACRRIFAGTAFGVERLRFESEPLAISFLAVAERAP